jgi:uncharacterized protein YndB with AHSA1/START domain
VFRRVLADPVDAAWPAMTESDRLGRWFGTYTGTGRVGGTVELLMTAAEDAGGPPSGVATLEPGWDDYAGLGGLYPDA